VPDATSAIDAPVTTAHPTASIVLATLNAKYIHCAFGLRYLQANLGELQADTRLLEFTINQPPLEIAEALLAAQPRIVGLGVYIWNTDQTLAVVRLLKTLRPDLRIVLGGPEISFEYENQPLFAHADHIVTGEGEVAFTRLCRDLLAGQAPPKVVPGGLPDVAALELPYALYSDSDIANRVVYAEASRGCPYRCEFCLSALDKKVRSFPLQSFIDALQALWDRGARQFKFVDRTFNLSLRVSKAILSFFLERPDRDFFVHFEMVPDRFPDGLRELISRFPRGTLQLEVGIQTFDESVAARIDRRQDSAAIDANLRWLVNHPGVHLHTDLIVGLPGEDRATFARGFDRLYATGAQEIQVGILKRLRGAPIARHTTTYGMVYSPLPPYEILQTAHWSRAELARMRRFARHWDVIANRGRLLKTLPMLLHGGSAFERFAALSDWLHEQVGSGHTLAYSRLVQLLFTYLTSRLGIEPRRAADTLADDYRRVTGKVHVPKPIAAHVSPSSTGGTRNRRDKSAAPSRQRRHEI